MGYAMRMAEPMTADEKAAHERAEVAFHEACRARDAAFAEPERRYFGGRISVEDAIASLKEQYPGQAVVVLDDEARTERYHALQSVVTAAMNEMYRTDVTYFRLNIWGMREASDVLSPLGMIHHYGNHPPFPQLPDIDGFDGCGMEVDGAYIELDEAPEKFPPAAHEYQRAHEDVLRFSPEVPGIPGWKFGSNDGWLVTPIDIQGAIAQLVNAAKAACVEPAAMLASTAGDRTYVVEFVEWMVRAIPRGGFRVH